MKVRVAIIGGGPSGAAAAMALARRGLSVAVIEPGGREKPGECLPPSAATWLARIGLDDPAAEGHRPSPGTRVLWSGDAVETDYIAHPAGHGWNLDRARFEAGLQRRAIAAGAGWIEGHARTVAAAGPPFALSVARAQGETGIIADAVLDASGRAAVFARRRAPRIVVDRWIAHHARLPGAPEDPRLLVERTAAGWWYSAGLADALVVSFQGHPGAGPAPGPETAARIGARAVPRWRRFAAGSARLGAIAGEGWLAIGDAAMAHDPLSGHGIIAALASGLEGAAAIADWLDGAGDALVRHGNARERAWTLYRAGLAAREVPMAA